MTVQAVKETGASAYSKQTFIKYVPRPEQVPLQTPIDSVVLRVDSLQFTWSETLGASRYHIEIIHDSVIVSDSVITTTAYTTKLRSSDTLYTWRVRAAGITGWGAWSVKRLLRIDESEEPTSVASADHLDVRIAPNPAFDRVQILGTIASSTAVSLCNFIGQEVVDRTSMDEGSKTLSVTHLPSGLYVLRIGTTSHIIQVVR